MNKLFLTLTCTLLLLACKTNKEIFKQQIDPKIETTTTGHIVMGLIEYAVVDSTIATQEMAQIMVDMMQSTMENELVYNSNRSAELVKENGTYVRRSLYDRSTKMAYQFLTKDNVQYFAKMDITQMTKEMESPNEDMDEFSKMFKNGSQLVDILGFKCNELTMMQPPDFTEVNSVAYTTNEIPHLSEAMGPLSKFIKGAPIKTTMFVEGISITFGALEIKKDTNMDVYLQFDPTKYTEVSLEELDMMEY